LSAFTAYFDASGDDHSQPHVTVGGFVATAGQWIAWEEAWLERLKLDGLTYFHRAELYDWKEARRARLIDDLCRITRENVGHKFGVVAVNEEMKTVSDEDRRQFHLQAYGICGRTVATEVKRWADSWGGTIPELVFEDGDLGKGHLIWLLESTGYPSPIFKTKKRQIHRKSGIVLEPAIPLQAGDLVAHNLFSVVRESYATGKEIRLHPDLDKIPGDVGRIEPERFRLLKQGFEQKDFLIMTTDVKINARGED